MSTLQNILGKGFLCANKSDFLNYHQHSSDGCTEKNLLQQNPLKATLATAQSITNWMKMAVETSSFWQEFARNKYCIFRKLEEIFIDSFEIWSCEFPAIHRLQFLDSSFFLSIHQANSVTRNDSILPGFCWHLSMAFSEQRFCCINKFSINEITISFTFYRLTSDDEITCNFLQLRCSW